MPKDPEVPKLRVNSYDAADRKPNQEEPGTWWKGPGWFLFFVAVHAALIAVAKQRGWEAGKIEYIRVGNVEGDPRIWIWPTDEKDPNRIRLRRYKSRFSANLSTVMIKWGMALPSGQKSRYDVRPDVNNESPVGPALYINKDKPLETKWEKVEKESRSRSKSQTPAQEAAPANQPPPPESEPTQN